MAPKPAAKAKGALGKKAGPLPVWAWVLIGGGALFAIYLVLRRNTEQLGSSSPVELVTGRSVAPQQAAYGGYPAPATPAAQMLDDEVLWTIAGSLATISEENREQGASLRDQLAAVKDNVSSTVAAATLAAPALSTPTQPATAPVKAKQPAPVRYFTYKPGAAPKGRKKDEAPAGSKLGFTAGKGYYVLA